LYITSNSDAFKSVNSLQLWGLKILAMIGLLAGNIRTIALPTFVTLLVPEKDRSMANGLTGMATGVAFLVVSVISGFLVGFGGMYYILILGLVVTTISIIHLWIINLPKKRCKS
jgi:DHA3 family multidrug efflux protein-like MFS transporter